MGLVMTLLMAAGTIGLLRQYMRDARLLCRGIGIFCGGIICNGVFSFRYRPLTLFITSRGNRTAKGMIRGSDCHTVKLHANTGHGPVVETN